METVSFYGVTLSEKEPLAQCEVTDDKVDQKLFIKHICLGVDAKDGEFNVVQAETRVDEKETLKIPIAVLKAGETRLLRPNIEFPSNSVTFKLIQGKGPVYIYGQLFVHEMVEVWGRSANKDDEDEDDFDEEDDDDDNEAPPPQTNGKKSNKKK